MKTQSSKFLFIAVVFALFVVTMSSCNRGYGCPYELKAATQIIKLR